MKDTTSTPSTTSGGNNRTDNLMETILRDTRPRKSVHFADCKQPAICVNTEKDQPYGASRRRYAQRKYKKSDWRRASTSAVSKADTRSLEKRRNTIDASPTPSIYVETLLDEEDGSSQSPIDYDESFLNPCYALDAAVARNDSRQLEAILSTGSITLDRLNASGGTAMHEAAFQGKIECLDVFLRFGSDVNLRDKERWTPLHAAVCGGNAQVVAFLISKGASLAATTDDGLRALEIAMDAKNTKILRVLSIAEAGAKQFSEHPSVK